MHRFLPPEDLTFSSSSAPSCMALVYHRQLASSTTGPGRLPLPCRCRLPHLLGTHLLILLAAAVQITYDVTVTAATAVRLHCTIHVPTSRACLSESERE